MLYRDFFITFGAKYAPTMGKDKETTGNLRQLMPLEARYRIRPELLDEFLAGGIPVKLGTYDAMIDAGEFDPDIYVVKEGLVRGTYMDQNLEKTAGFALPGTMLISFHCYYGSEPSYYRFEACCPTTVIRIPRDYFDALLHSSHEFALYVMSVNQNQLFYNECKNQMLSGDARSRLLQLTRRLSGLVDGSWLRDSNTPDNHDQRVKTELYTRWKAIFRIVPSKIIASYLGITEQHLSKIKRQIITSGKLLK